MGTEDFGECRRERSSSFEEGEDDEEEDEDEAEGSNAPNKVEGPLGDGCLTLSFVNVRGGGSSPDI